MSDRRRLWSGMHRKELFLWPWGGTRITSSNIIISVNSYGLILIALTSVHPVRPFRLACLVRPRPVHQNPPSIYVIAYWNSTHVCRWGLRHSFSSCTISMSLRSCSTRRKNIERIACTGRCEGQTATTLDGSFSFYFYIMITLFRGKVHREWFVLRTSCFLASSPTPFQLRSLGRRPSQ